MAIKVKDGKTPSLLIVIPWSPNLPAGVSVVVRNLSRIWNQNFFRSLIVVSDWASRNPKRDCEGTLTFRFALTGSLSFPGVVKLFILGPLTLFKTYELLNENSVGVVQFHYPSLNALGISLLKKMRVFRGQLTLCFHGTDVTPPKTVLEGLIWRVILSAANNITACSKSLALKIAQDYQVDLDRLTIAYNGVDAEMFSPDAQLNPLAETGLPESFIVTIGSYIPRKGHRYLLEAFSQIKDEFPGLGLVIVGQDGNDRLPLLAYAIVLGLNARIKFLVDLPAAEVANVVARARVCVQPSLAEPFGLAVIEAGACGVPVAASRVGGHAELIEDGKTGLLFSAGDSTSIARALRQLLNDENLSTAMAANFRSQILTQYTWEHCAEAYISASDLNQIPR